MLFRSRADGYHLLQTIFRFIDHGDTLHFSPRDDGELRLVRPLPGVPPESDLTLRAARLLQEETGCCKGVDILLEKRLPMGGGLGGGSSNAATVLLALNHLWGLGLPRERLQQIGLTLGADVPVFVFGQNAFAEGVGEALQAVELPPAWYVVLEPPVQVPTAAIFGAPELVRNTPSLSVPCCSPGFGHNDLEAVARARFPVVGEYLDWLAANAEGAALVRMSGSGACVFAGFEQREAAAALLARLPSSMRGWFARGLECHPLYR